MLLLSIKVFCTLLYILANLFPLMVYLNKRHGCIPVWLDIVWRVTFTAGVMVLLVIVNIGLFALWKL